MRLAGIGGNGGGYVDYGGTCGWAGAERVGCGNQSDASADEPGEDDERASAAGPELVEQAAVGVLRRLFGIVAQGVGGRFVLFPLADRKVLRGDGSGHGGAAGKDGPRQGARRQNRRPVNLGHGWCRRSRRGAFGRDGAFEHRRLARGRLAGGFRARLRARRREIVRLAKRESGDVVRFVQGRLGGRLRGVAGGDFLRQLEDRGEDAGLRARGGEEQGEDDGGDRFHLLFPLLLVVLVVWLSVRCWMEHGGLFHGGLIPCIRGCYAA